MRYGRFDCGCESDKDPCEIVLKGQDNSVERNRTIRYYSVCEQCYSKYINSNPLSIVKDEEDAGNYLRSKGDNNGRKD